MSAQQAVNRPLPASVPAKAVAASAAEQLAPPACTELTGTTAANTPAVDLPVRRAAAAGVQAVSKQGRRAGTSAARRQALAGTSRSASADSKIDQSPLPHWGSRRPRSLPPQARTFIAHAHHTAAKAYGDGHYDGFGRGLSRGFDMSTQRQAAAQAWPPHVPGNPFMDAPAEAARPQPQSSSLLPPPHDGRAHAHLPPIVAAAPASAAHAMAHSNASHNAQGSLQPTQQQPGRAMQSSFKAAHNSQSAQQAGAGSNINAPASSHLADIVTAQEQAANNDSVRARSSALQQGLSSLGRAFQSNMRMRGSGCNR